MKITKLIKAGLVTCLFFFSTLVAFSQGNTTSSMNGRVTDATGEALIGANLLVTHVPSGTIYGVSTDLDGYYRIPGMRVGGPYQVVGSYTGYEEFNKNDIYLTLGQAYKLDVEMKETAVVLEGVVVTSSRSNVFDGNRTGQETIIDENTINALPTVSRSIADFARLNPLAAIDENADGFSISIAGQNNRYNAIYIDGAVNNDVFGLAGSGTNGGQTGAGPVSIDAIEQFQVSVAPFDVRQSGFAGGSISAVTRSGTNNFEGSAYYFFRNETLAGKTPIFAEGVTRKPLNDFTAKTYGARLGGPILKNKLFFFVNAEIQDDAIPEPFEDFANYRGNSNRRSAIDSLVNKLGTYGYDPGTFEDNETTIERTFVLAKLDWNINNSNKLSLRHSVNSIDNLEARSSKTSFLGFQNGSEYFPSVTNSSAIELNSIFGSKAANNLVIGYTRVRDDRDVFGQDFPTIVLRDGSGSMEIGAEQFSSANRLDQDVFTITDNFSLYKGKHTLTFGTHNEFYKVANLFIRQNFGVYTYSSLNDFLTDKAPFQFARSYSQVDNVTGDDSKAIAAFSGYQLGLYAQDEIQLSEKLKLTAGLRIDMPVFPDDVPENRGFNDSTATKIEKLYGEGALQGAKTGSFIDPQLMISPRIGFNYDLTGQQKTQLRGGLGIFNSRLPLVWPGGAYNNFGFNIGGVFLTGASVANIRFNPDVNSQPPGNIDLNNPRASGQIDLFAADFKIPQIFRGSLALDHKLPNGLVATIEGLFSKTLNNVFYKKLDLKPATGKLSGTGDDRPTFNQADRVEPIYNGIFLATNTNKGYTYNLAATLTMPMKNGIGGTIGYSFGDAYSLNDNTSSQNNSQWRGYKNVNGLNEEGDPQRSIFAAGHRIFAQASVRGNLLKVIGAQLSIFYNGQSGTPFSWTYGDRGSGNAATSLINDGAFDNNNLIYVPKDQNDIKLVDLKIGDKTYTAADQWAILDAFIKDNKDLDNQRGSYAKRNTAFNKMSHIIDLKGTIDLYTGFEEGKQRHGLQLTLDVFNFTSLLGNVFDKDWGKIYFADSFDNFTLLNYAGLVSGTTTPQFRLNNNVAQGKDIFEESSFDDSGIRSSRWQMQVGVRYLFK